MYDKGSGYWGPNPYYEENIQTSGGVRYALVNPTYQAHQGWLDFRVRFTIGPSDYNSMYTKSAYKRLNIGCFVY